MPTGTPTILSTLDLTFYPKERGPYNFSVDRLNDDGTFKNPTASWGGIMRRLESNDFDEVKVKFIEFWKMDPFIYNPGSSGGDL